LEETGRWRSHLSRRSNPIFDPQTAAKGEGTLRENPSRQDPARPREYVNISLSLFLSLFSAVKRRDGSDRLFSWDIQSRTCRLYRAPRTVRKKAILLNCDCGSCWQQIPPDPRVCIHVGVSSTCAPSTCTRIITVQFHRRNARSHLAHAAIEEYNIT